MWRLSESDLYCVAMKMRRSPELMQLLSVKSMMRYGPAEKHRRFGAVSGQRVQTLAGAAGEQNDQRIVDHA